MATYIRLTHFKSSDEKEQEFFNHENRYEVKQEDFSKIPGSPIAYWISNGTKKFLFSKDILENSADVRKGLTTSNDDYFLKLWYETSFNDITFNAINRSDFLRKNKRWAPLNKGGTYRKWFGNLEYIINWQNDGYEIRNFKDDKGKIRSRPQNLDYSFLSGVTWNAVSSGSFCCRYVPNGFMMNDVGPTILNIIKI